MIAIPTRDWGKKLRFAGSFLRRRLVHVNLQLLYTCNYRCRICDFWAEAYRDKPRLSAAQTTVISEKLNQIGPQIISIGGGEPTLHPELVEIVRALARHHFPVMISNGSMMTPVLARALFQAGMVEISISLDYADPQKHDAQRDAPGAFAKAVEALEILHANRTHPEQRVNMISVIMDDNLAEVEPLLRRCEEMGITFLLTLYSRSRGSKPARPPAADVSRQLLDLKQRHRHFVALRGYLERFSQAITEGGVGPCHTGRNLCNIDSQGNLTLCIDRLDDPAGNIFTDDMRVIERRLRQKHRANPCRDCWTSCRGSIESLLYGKRPWLNLLDYFQMTRPVPLKGRF
ncbi:MAG: radical SAM protein [Verrucomicrobia bacterium]|nr:radical SAM protein [Verrucomicrobiota bacterium]